MTERNYIIQLTQRLAQVERGGITARGNVQHSKHQSIYEGSSWIDVNKDLISNGYLVASKCEPNKFVVTNEHKQVVSTDLFEHITGSERRIEVSNSNGKIMISCPQDIDKTSTPEFRAIKLTSQPIDQSDAVTKNYVDEKLKTIGPIPINTCSRIDVVNPTGDCLRVGRSDGIFVDVNVDADGTLNLTNEKPSGKTNDIDIYGQRINLLSNIDSTSPNSGSLVAYGGVGIMKDLQIGGGIFLRTETGIPTKLDFFEEGTLSVLWDGIWDEPIDTSILYQRIGSWVMLMIPYTANRATKVGEIRNSQSTLLPQRLRPIYDIKISVNGTDNGNETSMKASIFGDDGRIVIKPKDKLYIGEGISGFDTFCVQYMADPKQQS